MELLLGKNKNKHSTNTNNYIGFSLYNESNLIRDDVLDIDIDQYQQYMSEKDNSNKYRLIFAINPYCTNVLFNNITEIVYKEGSDDCIFFGDSGVSNLNGINSSMHKYMAYKGITVSAINFDRHAMIQDTGFSHKDIGPVVYHCGYDIFNNHTLRAKEFNVINKINTDDRKYFNTISDYVRDRIGRTVTEPSTNIAIFDSSERKIKLYSTDTINNFNDSIANNLIEIDGWVGFKNPSTMKIKNYNDLSLNKCMNNNKSCEMIDMYPDRSLFSFIPKYNKYRKRIEPNWKYCLTYPYESYYNDVVQNNTYKINGLVCEMMDKIDDNSVLSSNDIILFRTNIRHNFNQGSLVKLTIITESGYTEIPILMKIATVGLNGEGGDYYFSIRYDSIDGYVDLLSDNVEVRVSKYINGERCQYYFRKFKRLPNFKNSNIYPDNITKDDILKYSKIEFSSTLNKLAFERTVYNDGVAQIIFNDDIDVTGLRDNLGRKLSELYLTLVKSNDGYDQWYNLKNYTNSDITYSHCFGKVTSALDLPYYCKDYNVHKIHNIKVDNNDSNKDLKEINLSTYLGIYDSPLNLEMNNGEITIDGDTLFDGYGEFLGDIVELMPSQLSETILEDVYFRFNTMQREYMGYLLSYNHGSDNISVAGEYANLRYDEIYNDFLEFTYNESNFIKTYVYNQSKVYDSEGKVLNSVSYPANLNPEGYYYKPHYRLQIRELTDNVNEGYDIKISYTVEKFSNDGDINRISILTEQNYYFEKDDKIIFEGKGEYNGKYYYGHVENVKGDNFCQVEIVVPNSIKNSTMLHSFSMYRENPEKPKNTFSIGKGKYIWRDVKKEINIGTNSELYNSMFTNGAHYLYKNINFYLRRQDPLGEYGIRNTDNISSHVTSLIVNGNKKDVSKYEYVENDKGDNVC